MTAIGDDCGRQWD